MFYLISERGLVMKLVILAEKPSQGKAYDPKWTKWSLDSLPILPEWYEFQVAKGKSKRFNIIKKLLKGTDTVINGCDIDISP